MYAYAERVRKLHKKREIQTRAKEQKERKRKTDREEKVNLRVDFIIICIMSCSFLGARC